MIHQGTPSRRLIFCACITTLLLVGFALPLSIRGEQNKKAAEETSKAAISQNDVVQDLIRDVKKNEKLYADLKLSLISVYEKFPKPADINKQIQTETDIVIDLQGEKFRSEFKSNGRGTVQNFVGTENYTISINDENIDVFDGNTFRKFWAFDHIPDKKDKPRRTMSRGEISGEIPSVSNLARPHMFLRGTGGPRVPLSTYLEGARAITAYPGSGADMHHMYFEKKILGNEEFQGLQCIKVQMEWIGSKGKPVSRNEIWLASDRNLIPVRILHYKYHRSKEIPTTEFRVDAWKELCPGVWFPMKAHRDQYHSLSKKPTDKRELSWRVLYDVKSITLDPPQRAPHVFTKLDFPKGTTVDGLNVPGR
ncbi:hypothetical protein [uncultured Gimesia sp.]|uniref:hypothetical protein n=1 Tax=uncultured Gimesia sp. TaxID=1678688 RepID=UPI00262547FC|nr:hypothetical protein [uncultured Gimesia sp.]